MNTGFPIAKFNPKWTPPFRGRQAPEGREPLDGWFRWGHPNIAGEADVVSTFDDHNLYTPEIFT